MANEVTSLGESTLINYDTFYKSISPSETAGNLIYKAADAFDNCLYTLNSRLKNTYVNELTNYVNSTVDLSNSTIYIATKLSDVYNGLKQLENENTNIDAKVETLIEEKMNSIYSDAILADTGATVVEDVESESIWSKIGNFFGGIFNFIGDIVKKTLCTLVNAFLAVVQGLISFIESIIDAAIMLVGLVTKGVCHVVNLFGADIDIEAVDQWFLDVVGCDVAGQIVGGIYAAAPWIKENSWIADTWVESGIIGIGKWGGVVLTAAAITYFTAGAGTGPFIAAVMSSTGATVAVGAASGFGSTAQTAAQSGHGMLGTAGLSLIGAGVGAIEGYFVSGAVKAAVGNFVGPRFFIKNPITNKWIVNSGELIATPNGLVNYGQAVSNIMKNQTLVSRFLNTSATNLAGQILTLPTVLAGTKIGGLATGVAGKVGGVVGGVGSKLAGTKLGALATGIATSTVAKYGLATAGGIIGAGVLGNVLTTPQNIVNGLAGGGNTQVNSANTVPSSDDQADSNNNSGDNSTLPDDNANGNATGSADDNEISDTTPNTNGDSGNGSTSGDGSQSGGQAQQPSGDGSQSGEQEQEPSDNSTAGENSDGEEGADETLEEEVPTDGENAEENVQEDIDISNSTGWDRYQEALGDKVSDMYENDPEALKEQLGEYGYSDEQIEKIMSDEELAKEAVFRKEQAERMDTLLDIHENYQENPDKLIEQLKEYDYTDKEIEIIMKDEKLVREAFTSAELNNDFGITEDSFDRVLEINDMYYNDPDKLKDLLKEYEFTDRQIEYLMDDREMLQEAILAYEDQKKFEDSLSDIEIPNAGVEQPDYVINEDGTVTYYQGDNQSVVGSLEDIQNAQVNIPDFVTNGDNVVQNPESGNQGNNTGNNSNGNTSMGIDENGNIIFN